MEYNGKSYKVLNEKQEGKILYLALEETESIKTDIKDKFKFGERSQNNLKNIHPKLIEVMTESIKNSPYDFTIVDGVRTAERQNELYQQGRTKTGNIVTSKDGYNKKSNHQVKSDGFGYAVDLYPFIDGTVRTDYAKYKKETNAIAEHILNTAKKIKINVEWGGHWKSLFDPPHFELKN